MNVIGLLLEPALGSAAALAPGLIWASVAVWVTVAVMLASVVAAVTRRELPQTRGYRAARWNCRAPQACMACAC